MGDFGLGSLAKVPLDAAYKLAVNEAKARSASDEALRPLHDALLEDMDKVLSGIGTLQLKEVWAALDHLQSAFLMQARGNRGGKLEYFRLARDNARLAFGTATEPHWRTLATKISVLAAFHIHDDDPMAAKHLCCKFLQSLYSFKAKSDELSRDGASQKDRSLPFGLRGKKPEASGETLITLKSTCRHALGLPLGIFAKAMGLLPDSKAYAQAIFQTVTEINEWLLFTAPMPDAAMLQPTLQLGDDANGEPFELSVGSWYPHFCRTKQRDSARDFPFLWHGENIFQLLSGQHVNDNVCPGSLTPCVVSVSSALIRCWQLPVVASDTAPEEYDASSGASAVSGRAKAKGLPQHCVASIKLADNQIEVGERKTDLLVLDKPIIEGGSVCLCRDAIFALCRRKGKVEERTWLLGWQLSSGRRFVERELDNSPSTSSTPVALLGMSNTLVLCFSSGEANVYFLKPSASGSLELSRQVEHKPDEATGSAKSQSTRALSAACLMQVSAGEKSQHRLQLLVAAHGSSIVVHQLPSSEGSSLTYFNKVSADGDVTSLCGDQCVLKEGSLPCTNLLYSGSSNSIVLWSLNPKSKEVARHAQLELSGSPIHLAACFPRVLVLTSSTRTGRDCKAVFLEVRTASVWALTTITGVEPESTDLRSAVLTSNSKLLTGGKDRAVLMW